MLKQKQVNPTTLEQLPLPLALPLSPLPRDHGPARLQECLPLSPVRERLSVHPGEVYGYV